MRRALVDTQDVRDDGSVKHSVRVDWFRREPGGTTVFVKPSEDPGPAARQDHRDDASES